jgi:hypothetical protein
MPFEPGNKLATLGDHSKRKFMTQALIAELTEVDPKTQQTRLRKIIRRLLDNAEEGDNVAINAVFDRIEGKPKQALVNDDDNGAPFVIQVIRGGAKE